VWIGNDGKSLQSTGTPGDWENPKLSQDGSASLFLGVRRLGATFGFSIWKVAAAFKVYVRHGGRQQSALGSVVKRIIFASNRDGGIFQSL
jgi:hypothetical protein